MKISTYTRRDVLVIEISGRLDSTTAAQAQSIVLPLLETYSRIVFDLGLCPYISSPGINLLLMAGKQLNKVNGKGVLANLTPDVQEVMEMTGFLHVFKHFSSMDAAIEEAHR